MSDIFISYARSTEAQAKQIAEALRALGYSVWRDDEIPAHRDYSEVIEERLRAAKATVVVWSAEAVKSQWVRAEADIAREAGTLVQLSLDDVTLPMPFNRIQCADLSHWSGALESPGWKKVAASVAELVGTGSSPDPRSVDASPSLSEKPSIAVLPFTNLSGDPGQDYFADGMAVEVVTALSRFPSLFVTASGSSFMDRNAHASRSHIANELGVRYLLEGSVRRAGEHVRITVQLIEAAQNAQLWAERFDGAMEDVFDLQDRIANAVASQIEPNIQTAEIRRARRVPTQDLSSYDLYLRSLPPLRGYDKEAYDQGLGFLDQAIARDPNYALAMATAATFRSARVTLGWSNDPDQDRAMAMKLRAMALRIAPDDPDVLPLAAVSAVMTGMDKTVAEATAERALQRNPASAFAWLASGLVHVYGGKARLALDEFETCLRLDPSSAWRPIVLDGTAIALFSLGRFEEAIVLTRELCDLLPAFQPLYSPFIAAALAHSGRLAEAREMSRDVTIEPLTAWLKLLAPADRDLVLSGFALAQGRN